MTNRTRYRYGGHIDEEFFITFAFEWSPIVFVENVSSHGLQTFFSIVVSYFTGHQLVFIIVTRENFAIQRNVCSIYGALEMHSEMRLTWPRICLSPY